MVAIALAAGLNLLPGGVRARAMHQLSRMVGTLWHRTNRGAVRRVRHHLQVLFDYSKDDTTLESLVRSQLVLASWNALIANLLPSLREERACNLCHIEGLHYVDEIRRQNEGVLLLGSHYGVYGYAIVATLSTRGYPTRLVGYGDYYSAPPGTSYLYRKLYWPRLLRVGRWVKIITVSPGQESQPELHEVLEQKTDIIYLLPDEYFVVHPEEGHPPHLVPLRLLHHTVYLDVTGVCLAKQLGARPLTAIPTKDGYGQRVLIEPLEWTSTGTATGDIARDLQSHLTRLEGRLREYPALWRDLARPDLLPRMGMFEHKGAADG